MKSLVKLGLMVAVVVTIYTLRGYQAEQFENDVRAKATATCSGEDACLQALSAHFERCYAENHSSRRKGRFNREHSIDQAGFDTCLAAAAPQIAQATPRVLSDADLAAAEVRLEELGLLDGAGVYDNDAPEEPPQTAHDGTPYRLHATLGERRWEIEAEALAQASQEGLLEIEDASAAMLNGKAFEGEVLGQLTN